MRHHQPDSSHGPESPDRSPVGADDRATSTPAVESRIPSIGTIAGGGGAVDLPRGNGTASAARVGAVVALQRTRGNAAVQRVLTRDRAIQRHTSVVLEEPENAIQRSVIQRDLASDLSDEIKLGFFADPATITSAIDRATADDKRAVLNNLPLLGELRKNLDRADFVVALNKLGAPLADQLDAAMGAGKPIVEAIFAAIDSPATPAVQKQVVLRNPELMARLRTGLSQFQACTVMRKLGAPLSEQLLAASEGKGADTMAIFTAIAAAPADQKATARRDRELVKRLSADLDLEMMLKVLDALGASLSDRLTMAADDWFGGEEAIFKIIEGATDAQRREVLANSNLMKRLRIEFATKEFLRLLTTLHASLPDKLEVVLDGGSAIQVEVYPLLGAATEAERAPLKENTALLGRLRTQLNAFGFWRVAFLLGLPEADQQTAPGATPPDPAGQPDAISGADPLGPRTLVGKINQALDLTPPDPAVAMEAIVAATPTERETLTGDGALRRRLFGALDEPNLLKLMPLLKIGIVGRMTALLDRKAPLASLQAQITAATPDEKGAVLDDRALVERLGDYAGEAQRAALMTALGDAPGNQIDHLLANKPTAEAVRNLIGTMDAAGRQGVMTNSAVMGRIAAEFSADEYLLIQVVLRYGGVATTPLPVLVLLRMLEASPTLVYARQALRSVADADLELIRGPVREYLKPRLSADDFAQLGRILDQGLIVDETINEKDPGRKMLANHPNPYLAPFLFKEMEFTGTRGFEVAYYRDRVQVVVRVEFTPTDDWAKTNLSTLMAGYETAIEGAWDNKYRLRNAARTLPIRIDMIHNSGKPHFKVNIHGKTNPVWGEYNTNNWYPRATNFAASAPLHEFGHMLGNPDEYNLSAAVYQTRVGTAGATDVAAGNATVETDAIGQQRFTNDVSLMGGSGTTVEPRHLNYFTNWLNRNRTTGEPAYTLI